MHWAGYRAIGGVNFPFVQHRSMIVRADVRDRMKAVRNAENSDLKFGVELHSRPFAAQHIVALADVDKHFSVAEARREVIIGKNIHNG